MCCELWAWDADPDFDEQAGEQWLFLLPMKWNPKTHTTVDGMVVGGDFVCDNYVHRSIYHVKDIQFGISKTPKMSVWVHSGPEIRQLNGFTFRDTWSNLCAHVRPHEAPHDRMKRTVNPISACAARLDDSELS